MASRKANRELADIRESADKVNGLLLAFKKKTGDVTTVLNSLRDISGSIDKELMKLVTTIESMENSEEGVTDLRQLKALNGLNGRMVNGLVANLSRIKDTSSNSVNVS